MILKCPFWKLSLGSFRYLTRMWSNLKLFGPVFFSLETACFQFKNVSFRSLMSEHCAAITETRTKLVSLTLHHSLWVCLFMQTQPVVCLPAPFNMQRRLCVCSHTTGSQCIDRFPPGRRGFAHFSWCLRNSGRILMKLGGWILLNGRLEVLVSQ